jgi:hypothetical protein
MGADIVAAAVGVESVPRMPVKVIIIGPVSSARTRSTRLTTSRSTLFGRGARTWPTHCAAPDAPTFRGGSSGSLAEFGTPSKDHHLSTPERSLSISPSGVKAKTPIPYRLT